MGLELIDFDGVNPLLGPLEGGTFLSRNGTRFACYYFRAQKSLDFQGPSLPMALEMDLSPSESLCHAPFKQQVH
jgi:hypothetical protein